MAPRTSGVSGGRRRILLTSLFIGLPSNGQRALSVVPEMESECEMLTATYPTVKAAANMAPLCPFPSMAPVPGDQ